MKALMARGAIGDEMKPAVFEVNIVQSFEPRTWTWIDERKNRGLTIIRPIPEFNHPRVIDEWMMYGIECEMSPGLFNRMLLKRPANVSE